LIINQMEKPDDLIRNLLLSKKFGMINIL